MPPWWRCVLVGVCVGVASGAIGLRPFGYEWFAFVVPMDIALLALDRRA